MKTLRFILYLIMHGKLIDRPANFNALKLEHLSTLEIDKQIKLTFYQKIRNHLVLSRVTGPLIDNLTYLKNLSLQHKNFFVVDTLQLCYLRILKAASTSTLRVLLPVIDTTLSDQTLTDKQIDLLASHYASTSLSSKQENHNLFTIVRNPFHRLVSVYLDLFDRDTPHFGYQTYLFGIFRKEMTFKEFVKVISIIPANLRSSHLASQIDIIQACGGLKKIKCYRLDKDKEMLETFLKSKGLKLNHNNKHKKHYDYRTFYDHETAEAVYKIYHQDVVVFDYQKEFDSLISYLEANI